MNIMKNIKENIIKNRIVIYISAQLILFQVVGIIVFKKYNNPDLNHIFINIDIAAILAFLSLVSDKILEIKNKKLEYILNYLIALFVLYSLLPFYRQ